uniref:Uncharacterized protein n=1 Tax=Arundo donax TaxID=35708 RepID=A0A0A9DJC5_ARUDO
MLVKLLYAPFTSQVSTILKLSMSFFY